MSRNINRVCHKKGIVEIGFTDENEGVVVESLFKCQDIPREGFILALARLANVAADVCMFPEPYRGGIRVQGVTLKESEKRGLGCTIHALKDLEGSNSPLNIHTPLLYEKTEDGTHGLDGWHVDALDDLVRSAFAYLEGDREKQPEQLNLLGSDGEDEDGDSEGDGE